MNKLTLIVFLAVCLISAHAFVRRDAPAPAAENSENYIDKIQKDITDVASKISEDVAKVFNPDNIKDNFSKFVDSVNQTIQNLQPKPQQ